jgi:chemotaxis protein MotB
MERFMASKDKDGADTQPIIIRKMKKKHEAHASHGAWKVAYADFITAMMALFLLLWLLNSVPKKTLEGLQEYFSPTILNGQLQMRFNEEAPTEVSINIPNVESAPDFSQLSTLISNTIFDSPEMKEFKDNVLIEQTPEGLKIEIMDNEKRTMFVPGSPKLQSYTKVILGKVTKIVKMLPYYIAISGHTNSSPTRNKEYDNWDLSTDRANFTRKFLYSIGLEAEQITKVIGRADHEPLEKDHLESSRNMRITLLLLKTSSVPYQKRSAK